MSGIQYLTMGVAGALAGGALVKKLWLKKFAAEKSRMTAAEQERDLLYIWLLLEQKDVKCEEYFSAHGYGSVAVFGMNKEGRLLARQLRELAVYAAERDNLSAVHERLVVYRVGDDPLPPADCMVICDTEQITEKLEAVQKEFSGVVVTLAQVLDWLLKEHRIQPREGALADWPPQALIV